MYVCKVLASAMEDAVDGKGSMADEDRLQSIAISTW